MVVQWLGLWVSTAGGMGLMLFRELRSRVQHGAAKKNTNKQTVNDKASYRRIYDSIYIKFKTGKTKCIV